MTIILSASAEASLAFIGDLAFYFEFVGRSGTKDLSTILAASTSRIDHLLTLEPGHLARDIGHIEGRIDHRKTNT